MTQINVQFCWTEQAIKQDFATKDNLPFFATPGSSGIDFRACITEPISLKSIDRCVIPLGLSIAIPRGYELQLRARSGLAFKYGITLTNSVGSIDSDYRGELQALITRVDPNAMEFFRIEPGDRICQGVFAKIEQPLFEVVNLLPEENNRVGGFGSTGVK